MAIQLKEDRSGDGGMFWESILMIVSIVFFAVSLIMFLFFFFYLNPQKANQLVEANNTFASLADPQIVIKEKELTTAQKEIDDFKVLYENNPKASAFFDAFQKWAQPNIVFNSLSLDVLTKRATLTGVASGFQSIIAQMAILRTEPTIESFQVSNIALGQTGGVLFNLDVSLKADLFK